MASGLTCRLALVCAQPTASILCRSRPPGSTGISWPRSRIRACPGKGRGLVGGYHRYPDRRGLALPGRDPRPVHPQDSWLGDARAYARRTYHGRTDHGRPTAPPRAGLIHHADRGSQYAADDYRKILQATVITPSMSRKPNCWDNAPIESVFGTLKTELVHQREYPDRDAARPVRVHRSLLQSSADPLRYRLHHPTAGRPENRTTPCPLSRGKVSASPGRGSAAGSWSRMARQ